MKKFILVFGITSLSFATHAQIPDSGCVMDDSILSKINLEEKSSNCSSTSPYWVNNSLYVPDTNQDLIYLKANFIFLTKPDGTGNFEQNNPEHIAVIDEMISRANWSLGNLLNPTDQSCITENTFVPDTKIRLVVNKIWKVDPAWDFLVTGFVQGGSISPIYPPSSSYYYSYLDNDSTIPDGVNVVFSNNGDLYQDLVLDQNYQNHINDSDSQKWAASQFPSTFDLTRSSRQFYPDIFNRYVWFKEVLTTSQNIPWSTTRSWFIGTYGFNFFPHEFGHSFFLFHQQSCNTNIMYQGWPSNPRYMRPIAEIGRSYRYASISNIRQFITDDSFTNSNININGIENWDLDFRLYSNVTLENSSELNLTCNLILPPQSRIIVKNNSSLKIEGGFVNSSNETSWNGIKIQDNSSLEILPETEINNGYFYAYTDNSSNRTHKGNKPMLTPSKPMLEARIEKEYKDIMIYPNPSENGFITVNAKDDKKLIGTYFKIIDGSGKVLIIHKIEKNIMKINIQKLKKGIYYVLINQKSKILIKSN